MEIKRYDDFSSLKPIEDRIEEVIDLFPDFENLVDIFQSLDGFELEHINPCLYKSIDIYQKEWCGGILIDGIQYFSIDRQGDKSKLDELYFQELIYPPTKLEAWFNKKWRSFSLKQFQIKDDKIIPRDNLNACFKVVLRIYDTRIGEYNFNHDEMFQKEIEEIKSYLHSRKLNFILIRKIKDSKLTILVISEKFLT